MFLVEEKILKGRHVIKMSSINGYKKHYHFLWKQILSFNITVLIYLIKIHFFILVYILLFLILHWTCFKNYYLQKISEKKIEKVLRNSWLNV